MSNMQKPAQDPTFDFWEFVSCARCHLPFTPESGGPQSVPFWITECGHVVCNNHLSKVSIFPTRCTASHHSQDQTRPVRNATRRIFRSRLCNMRYVSRVCSASHCPALLPDGSAYVQLVRVCTTRVRHGSFCDKGPSFSIF